jgi:hypothetical protein
MKAGIPAHEPSAMNNPVSDPRRRRRRLLFLPVTLLGLLLVLGLGAYVRGTWADDVPRDPASAAEAPLAQVLRRPDGGREVRCAIRLPFPPEEVWSAVTDYDNFGDICECIQAKTIRHEPDGTCRLEAEARSGLPGTVPFAVELRQERGLDRYVSSWDEPGGCVRVNRGRWELTAAGPRETLAALSLELEVEGVPTFVLRNLSLGRLREVLLGLERRLRSGSPGKPW